MRALYFQIFCSLIQRGKRCTHFQVKIRSLKFLYRTSGLIAHQVHRLADDVALPISLATTRVFRDEDSSAHYSRPVAARVARSHPTNAVRSYTADIQLMI